MNFVGVAARADLDEMQEFVADADLQFVQIADFDQTVWTQWSVVSQPAFVFLNDDGGQEGHLGALGADALLAKVEALR